MNKMIYMISLLLLLGCTGANIKYSDTEMKNGLIYAKNNSKPYTGKVTFYDLESESIFGTGDFVNGKEEGVAIGYYENGEVQSKLNYKDGKLEGTSKWYYENGNIKDELTFTDNHLEIKREYYENGQLAAEITSIKNEAESLKLYNEQGERINLIEYYSLRYGNLFD